MLDLTLTLLAVCALAAVVGGTREAAQVASWAWILYLCWKPVRRICGMLFAPTTSSKLQDVEADVAEAATEVARRRAKQEGMFKYCGLRPDPFASATPPVYTHKGDPGLPQEALKPGEAEALVELRRRLSHFVAAQQRTDNATLVRYLRARHGDVGRAAEMFQQWMAFREKWDMDGLEDWNLDAYERCLRAWWLPGGFLKHSLLGEPVFYERLGRSKLRNLVGSLDLEFLQKCDMVHCTRMHAALEEDALRRAVPLSGCLIVFDLAGFGWDQASLHTAQTLAKLVESRDLLMPELISRMIIVNASSAFAKAWQLFGHVLPPDTKAKVQVASAAESKGLLKKHIDEESLPGFLGGAMCVDGDPECSRIIAPGGLVPDSVLEEFKQLAVGPQSQRTRRAEIADRGVDHAAGPRVARGESRSSVADFMGGCCGRVF